MIAPPKAAPRPRTLREISGGMFGPDPPPPAIDSAEALAQRERARGALREAAAALRRIEAQKRKGR